MKSNNKQDKVDTDDSEWITQRNILIKFKSYVQ